MSSGWHMTEEQKARVRAAHVSHAITPETRAKMIAGIRSHPAYNKGVPLTDEQKAVLSAANMGKKASPETRAKMSATHKKRLANPEVRAKISARAMGHAPTCLGHTAEDRAKQSAAQMGHTVSAEARAKIGIGNWKGGRRVSSIKANTKRRALDFTPLNEWFEGSEGHHTDKEFVIYVPYKLHHSVSHNVWTGRNMDKINALAYEWLAENMNAPAE